MKPLSIHSPWMNFAGFYRSWIAEYSITEYTLLFLMNFTAIGVAVLLIFI